MALPPCTPLCLFLGKEHFPAEWPQEVLQTFKSLLAKGVVATAQHFDGFANVLSLNMYTESGGGHLSAVIMDALHAQVENKLMSTSINRTAERNDRSQSAAVPVCPQPELIPKTEKGQGDAPDTGTGRTVGPGLGPWTSQQDKNTSAVSVIGWFSHIFMIFFCIQIMVFLFILNLTKYCTKLSLFDNKNCRILLINKKNNCLY